MIGRRRKTAIFAAATLGLAIVATSAFGFFGLICDIICMMERDGVVRTDRVWELTEQAIKTVEMEYIQPVLIHGVDNASLAELIRGDIGKPWMTPQKDRSTYEKGLDALTILDLSKGKSVKTTLGGHEVEDVYEKVMGAVEARVKDGTLAAYAVSGLSPVTAPGVLTHAAAMMFLQNPEPSSDSLILQQELDFAQRVKQDQVARIAAILADSGADLAGRIRENPDELEPPQWFADSHCSTSDNDGSPAVFTSQAPAGSVAFPLQNVTPSRITSHYSMSRRNPVTGIVQPHYGVDIAGKMGEAVMAVGSGKVTRSGYSTSGGHTVVVKHADGTSSIYCHLDSRAVTVGQTVAMGQTLGGLGSTGHSTGPHLHFGMKNAAGQYINPEDVLPPIGARGAMERMARNNGGADKTTAAGGPEAYSGQAARATAMGAAALNQQRQKGFVLWMQTAILLERKIKLAGHLGNMALADYLIAVSGPEGGIRRGSDAVLRAIGHVTQ